MGVLEIIARKRDGQELTESEIATAVRGFVAKEVTEAQMAALLMAIFLRGMSPAESAALTVAMAQSGDRLDLSAIPGVKVDKHSTGGVGDKTTLVVAPLVAAFGVAVPKMSGPALGHTGGTIDKLESIPGLTTRLSAERFCRQVAQIGLAIARQTDTMVPADKLIYALRDATATVESIPLIASSVMSKKLAVGADAIVLDVKAGRGAFMSDVERATELAQVMVHIGEQAGKRVVALVTRMDQPLGAAVGDAVELAEAITTLAGRGPEDFAELCEIVAGHMLALGRAAASPEEGRALARKGLRDGVGLAKLRAMVAAQGGDPAVVDAPESLSAATREAPVMPAENGFVTGVDARRIGLAVRTLKEAAGPAGHACGVLLRKKMGDRALGEAVATVLAPLEAAGSLQQVAAEVAAAYQVGPQPPAALPLVAGVVGQ